MKRRLLLVVAGLGMACADMVRAQVTTLTVYPDSTYQTIVGMGGHGISTDANYIKYLFDYLGCTAYRHWIEVEDITNTYVTLQNIADGTVPFKDVDATAISFFNTLKSKGVTVIATCWSPPACLKKNNCVAQKYNNQCGGSPCGSYSCPDPDNYLLPEHYDEYARYLALWAKDFQKKTGINLYAVSIQNEPLFNEPYASALLYSSNYGKALQAVHDTFAKYPELAGIKFFGPEHMCNYNGNTSGNGKYIQEVLQDPVYGQYLDAYAVHGYSDGIAPDLSNSLEWATFAQRVVVEKGKMMWMTETSGDFTQWADAYGYMKGMFMSFKSGRVSLYTYWGMGGGLYATGSPTRQLYNHMHYYRFVRPGAQMIKVEDSDKDVEAIGFKKGSGYTVIVINLVKTAKTVQFSDFPGRPAFFHVYRSTEKDMCAYVGKVTNNTFELPGESVVTITYDATSPDVTYGPHAPANLIATSIADNSITVKWDAVAAWTLNGSPVNITGYVVYLNGVKKTSTPITATSYTFTNLKPGTQYTIEVIARDAMYNQSISSTLTVTTTCNVGGCTPIIGIEEEKDQMVVSPNPATGVIVVQLPEGEFYTVSIVGMTGKVEKYIQQVNGTQTIDVSDLPSGIYIVMAANGSRIHKTKLVIE